MIDGDRCLRGKKIDIGNVGIVSLSDGDVAAPIINGVDISIVARAALCDGEDTIVGFGDDDICRVIEAIL